MALLPTDLLMIERGGAPYKAELSLLASLLSSGSGMTWMKLAADVANSTTTLANVTGMAFAAAALTTYKVKALIPFQSAATTTGEAAALDVPTGALVYGLNIHATGAASIGGCEQIADGATTGASTGVRAANTPTLLVAEWLVIVGANAGTVQLMMRSEVAASVVTFKAGGIFGYQAVL